MTKIYNSELVSADGRPIVIDEELTAATLAWTVRVFITTLGQVMRGTWTMDDAEKAHGVLAAFPYAPEGETEAESYEIDDDLFDWLMAQIEENAPHVFGANAYAVKMALEAEAAPRPTDA